MRGRDPATYAYDDGGRLTEILTANSGGETIARSAYTHDKVGNRLGKTTGQESIAYTYDAIYRLREALSSTPGNSPQKESGKKGKGVANAVQNQREFYDYDAVGNRLRTDDVRSYAHNAGNQLLSAGGATYTYDANGNRASKTTPEGTTTYGWDAENRLTRVEMPGGSVVTFAYDPFGRRIEKKVVDDEGESLTCYLYDNEDILYTYDANGEVVSRFIHGPGIDEPLALLDKKGSSYYHADGLGSIVAMTDDRARNVQQYEYDSFGNQHDMKNRIKQPYGYTGREHDRETGLRYYRARYYDGEVGRFISEDPLSLGGYYLASKYGVGFLQYIKAVATPYTYTENDPINYSDPYGLMAKGGKQNIGTEGFTKLSDPVEVEKALEEAIKAGQKARAAKLRGLLKVIKRGGTMSVVCDLFICGVAREGCLSGDMAACQTYEMLCGEVNYSNPFMMN